MERTKGLLMLGVSKAFSLSLIKKGLVLFVLGSMLVNGFAYGAMETSRNGIVVVAVKLAGSTMGQIFSKCNDSLVAVTNKISEEISGILKKALGKESGEFAGGGGGREEEKGASGSGATGEITIAELRKESGDTKVELWTIFRSTVKLFKLYSEYKIPLEAGMAELIVVMFIMFIAVIMRRKEIESCGNIVFNRRKIRISA